MDTSVIELSVVIVNWNTQRLLRNCIASVIAAMTGAPYEIIVVDNNSSDGSVAMVEHDYPSVILIRNTVNRGHAAANNQAILRSRGKCILLLNSDVIVMPGCIDSLAAVMKRDPSIAVLCAQSLNQDHSVQVCSRRLPTLKTAFFYDTVLEWWFPESRELQRYLYRDWQHDSFSQVEQPPITCLLVKRDIFRIVGLFDERFFIFYSDPDWFCRMKKAGIKAFFTPEAKVIHLGRASLVLNPSINRYWHKDKLRYYKKHFGVPGYLFVKMISIADCCIRMAKILAKRGAGMMTGRETADGLYECFSVMRA